MKQKKNSKYWQVRKVVLTEFEELFQGKTWASKKRQYAEALALTRILDEIEEIYVDADGE